MGHTVSFEKLTIVIFTPTANTFICRVFVRVFDGLSSVLGGIGHDGVIDMAAVSIPF
jgi:hypothetical protein